MQPAALRSQRAPIPWIGFVLAVLLVGLGLRLLLRDSAEPPRSVAANGQARIGGPEPVAGGRAPLVAGTPDARAPVAATQESVEARLARIDAALADWAHAHGGYYPLTLQALTVPDDRGRVRLHPEDVIDPWGRPFVYSPPGHRAPLQLLSLGRDGQPGGSGEDADRLLGSGPR